LIAEDFQITAAVITASTGVVKPGDTDGVSLFESPHARAETRDSAGYFVSEHERDRHARLESFPFAASEVKIAVAEAASLDPNENLAGSGNRLRNLSQGQWFAEAFQKRSLHRRRLFESRVDIA
jgi:hypothetical protein